MGEQEGGTVDQDGQRGLDEMGCRSGVARPAGRVEGITLAELGAGHKDWNSRSFCLGRAGHLSLGMFCTMAVS